MPQRQDIIRWCNEFLRTAEFHDYAPNGLQVEGREEVRKIVCAVTASQAAIDYAVVQNADMLLVHHGLFWKSEPIWPAITCRSMPTLNWVITLSWQYAWDGT